MPVNLLIVNGLIIYTIIRVVGGIVATDLYMKTRNTRHLLQVMGWIFIIIAAMLPFGTLLTENEFIRQFFSLSSNIFLNIGMYFLMVSLSIYFVSYERMYFIVGFFFIPLIPYSFFLLLNYQIATVISELIRISVLIGFIYVVYVNREEIKEYLTYSYGIISLLMISVVLFMVTNIYSQITGFEDNIFTVNDPFIITLNYGIISLVTLLGVIVFLHIEQGISVKQKNQLKDDYSHKIGNLLQVITAAGSLIKIHSDDKDLLNNKADLIIEKVNEAGELVKEIRNM